MAAVPATITTFADLLQRTFSTAALQDGNATLQLYTWAVVAQLAAWSLYGVQIVLLDDTCVVPSNSTDVKTATILTGLTCGSNGALCEQSMNATYTCGDDFDVLCGRLGGVALQTQPFRVYSCSEFPAVPIGFLTKSELIKQARVLLIFGLVLQVVQLIFRAIYMKYVAECSAMCGRFMNIDMTVVEAMSNRDKIDLAQHIIEFFAHRMRQTIYVLPAWQRCFRRVRHPTPTDPMTAGDAPMNDNPLRLQGPVRNAKQGQAPAISTLSKRKLLEDDPRKGCCKCSDSIMLTHIRFCWPLVLDLFTIGMLTYLGLLIRLYNEYTGSSHNRAWCRSINSSLVAFVAPIRSTTITLLGTMLTIAVVSGITIILRWQLWYYVANMKPLPFCRLTASSDVRAQMDKSSARLTRMETTMQKGTVESVKKRLAASYTNVNEQLLKREQWRCALIALSEALQEWQRVNRNAQLYVNDVDREMHEMSQQPIASALGLRDSTSQACRRAWGILSGRDRSPIYDAIFYRRNITVDDVDLDTMKAMMAYVYATRAASVNIEGICDYFYGYICCSPVITACKVCNWADKFAKVGRALDGTIVHKDYPLAHGSMALVAYVSLARAIPIDELNGVRLPDDLSCIIYLRDRTVHVSRDDASKYSERVTRLARDPSNNTNQTVREILLSSSERLLSVLERLLLNIKEDNIKNSVPFAALDPVHNMKPLRVIHNKTPVVEGVMRLFRPLEKQNAENVVTLFPYLLQ